MTLELPEVPPVTAASLGMVRALALLVERLSQLQLTPPTPASADERRDAVRDALRTLTAAARGGHLHLAVDESGMHVNEGVLLPGELRGDRTLLALARKLVSHAVGTLTIRQGAAPGELLTLGRLLSEPPQPAPSPAAADTPTPRRTPTEVLRSWSVLVTPASTPLLEPEAVPATVGSAMGRLHAARTDDAAQAAVEVLLALAADAEANKDGNAIEAIAQTFVTHARALGPGEGRLATEGGLRQLLREPVIALLAARVPHTSDRDALIAVLSRAGEIGGRALVSHLMNSEDRPSRRSYFDAIIAQDAGRSQLREALADSRWYVVRNAAALLGEMGMAEADAPLIPLLAHLDERIRIAAARALTRLRTPRGLSSLQQRLGDGNAEVRRLAAAAFRIASTLPNTPKPNSAPLAAALAKEPDEDVALEMIAALGKLGSADAVQRLIRMAMDTSPRMVDRPWFRVATLEALVEARGHAAVPVLEAVVTDGNEEVAAAARRLLGIALSGR